MYSTMHNTGEKREKNNFLAEYRLEFCFYILFEWQYYIDDEKLR